ncbi:hypothetical protein CC86DRAFT_463533 [Ophiobolus disseminans]|uniref:Uncharacterized protein n=1 Tax=Ophiobolus disseminans TaxID=1469910 RepID=A0A6A7AEL4_9PLEO|nr:hypothetical protein CC86DRAFT_463533 [Ophiobolus disseminans]
MPISQITAFSTPPTLPHTPYTQQPPSLTMLLPSRHQKSHIFGIPLTHTRATSLLSTTSTLLSLLTTHLSSIRAIGLHDSSSTSHLRAIQDQQSRIQTLLERFVDETKPSCVSWVHEISDLHLSALAKLRCANRSVRNGKLDRADAACMYYPRVGETYASLAPHLALFKLEVGKALADEARWERNCGVHVVRGMFRAASPEVKGRVGKSVRFEKEVRGRYIAAGNEEPVVSMQKGKEFTVPLKSDRKRTDRDDEVLDVSAKNLLDLGILARDSLDIRGGFGYWCGDSEM